MSSDKNSGKFKKNLSHIGTSIRDSGTNNLKPGNIKKNLNSLGSNIKETGSHIKDKGIGFKDSIMHSKAYNVDDELILHYQHDLKMTIKALKYLTHEVHKFSTSYWPKVFDSTLNITSLFADIIGANSLHFKGIEKTYEEFDRYLADQEIPTIHPKEKEVVIESMNNELKTFFSVIDQLKLNITSQWRINSQSLKIRILEMNTYLKNLIKLIDRRNSKCSEFLKVQKKVEKLVKRYDPLTEKELAHLNALEEELVEVRALSTKLNDKTKTILPHALLLTEEFIDQITSTILCNLCKSYLDIDKCLQYYSTFFGYLTKSEEKVLSYDEIKEKWEISMTPAKSIVESSLSLIYDKNPDLIEQDIDSEDKTTLHSKILSNTNKKIHTKSHNLKCKDHINGFFNDYLSADILDSFENFSDINLNKSDTYYPSKKIDVEDIHPSFIVKPGPPLPPRENIAFKALPDTPKFSMDNSQSMQPNEIYFSDSESDKETASISSDFSVSNSSISNDVLTESLSPDLIQNNLKHLYNNSKNDIKNAPINPESSRYHKEKHSDITSDTSTLSYKLKGIYDFFDKISKVQENQEKKELVAKYDFNGDKIGDLSFKKGDIIEILLDFQNVSTLFKSEHKNWMIGLLKDGDLSRVGFVPNNYF